MYPDYSELRHPADRDRFQRILETVFRAYLWFFLGLFSGYLWVLAIV